MPSQSGITGTSTSINGLDPSTKYQVRVRAVNSAGASAWGPYVPFTTLASSVSERPTALNSSAMSGPYYEPIPADPVLDPDSASRASSIFTATPLAGLNWVTASFAVPEDPMYDIQYDQDPLVQPGQEYDWAYSDSSMQTPNTEPVRIPNAPYFYPQPGVNTDPDWDGWGAVVDLERNLGWAGWRMVKVNGEWQAVTAHAFPLDTLATVTEGIGRGDGLPAIAGSVTVQEVQAALDDATDTYVIPHALAMSVSSDLVDNQVRFPAVKTDGDRTPSASTVSEGMRLRLAPSAPVSTSNRLMRALCRTLKIYGAYIVDRNGSSGVSVNFERSNPADPDDMVNDGVPSDASDAGAIARPYFDAGMEWDYFALTEIPWSQMQVLLQWDGGGVAPEPVGGDTVTHRISNEADDGYITWGSLNPDGLILGTDYQAPDSQAYLRFPGMTIPRGATIASATLTLTPEWADTGDLAVLVRGAATDNFAQPTTSAAVSGQALTTASAALNVPNSVWLTGNPVTVDVTSVIQAIVNRSGWLSGNALGLITSDNGTTGMGYFLARDSSSGASAPVLVVQYE